MANARHAPCIPSTGMWDALKKIRHGLRRRWFITLLGTAAIIWVFFQIFPRGSRGVNLELMALGADGRFAGEVSIPNHWATSPGEGGSSLRVPLILAVRNTGSIDSPPAKLELSLPARYRITRGDGRPLPAELLPGTPMARYWLDVPPTDAASGTIAGYLPVLDTLWLEPIIPSFYCITLADSVPDFVPSPPAPVEAISDLRIFYSFTAEALGQRQTGLLAVGLDPELLERETRTPPPVHPTHYTEPGAPGPNLADLRYVGSRHALCGDPEDPLEILSTLWETPGGGRIFVLDYGGAPRKYLYDLNRDSIIELEIWDASGSGSFDARRRAELPIPSFLFPPSGPPAYDPSYLARLSPEELLALDRYGQGAEGPQRFSRRAPDERTALNRYRPGSIGYEEGGRRHPSTRPSMPGIPPMGGGYGSEGRRAAPQMTRPAPPASGMQLPPGERAPPSARPGEVRPPRLRPGETHPEETRPGGVHPRESRPQETRPETRPGEDRPRERPAEEPARRTSEGARPSEPKLLGKPLGGEPDRPPPDTTGARP